MRHAARGWLPAALLLVLAFVPGTRAAEEQDKYEEQVLTRCAERAFKAAKGDRARWVAALETAFPGKVVNATTEDEYMTWFALVAGKNEEWRRDDTPTMTELFDKVVQRLELGPVPSLKRDEFARYAKKLARDGSDHGRADPNEDADRVFRVLDRNGDGELGNDELPTALRDGKLQADADGNGRVTKEEYRTSFQKRVQIKVDAITAKVNGKSEGDPLVRGKDGKAFAGAGLPDWFRTLDTDNDGQVALFEWRKAGRPVAEFAAMDLNADGLLTRDEYLRYVKQTEDKKKQQQREDNQRP